MHDAYYDGHVHGWGAPTRPMELAMTTFTHAFAGAQTRPILEKLGDIIDGADLGLVGDNSTDNAAAFARLNNLNDGDTIQIRPGRYRYTGSIPINKRIKLVGSGRLDTTLVPLTANAPGMTINVGWAQVRNLAMERITKPIIGGDGIVTAPLVGNTILEDLWLNKHYRGLVLGAVDVAYARFITVQNCESHGVVCSYGTNGAMQWYLHDILSQSNLGDGFNCVNTTAATGIGPFMHDCHSFNNTTGYYFQGDATHTLNDVWLLRCVSSSESTCGIHFHDTYGNLSMVHDLWVELVGQLTAPRGFDGVTAASSQVGHGVRFTGNQSFGGNSIVGGVIWGCSYSGLTLESPNLSVLGIVAMDNGVAAHASLENRAGIVVKANGCQPVGCRLIRSTGGSGQVKGITVSGVVNDISTIGNHFQGYPTVTDMVDTSLATLTGMTANRIILGPQINVGRINAAFVDETAGPNPSKPVRVVSGALQILNNAVTEVILSLDESAVANDTRLLLWDVTAGSLKRVSRGAVDSGGAGFRLLRIPN